MRKGFQQKKKRVTWKYRQDELIDNKTECKSVSENGDNENNGVVDLTHDDSDLKEVSFKNGKVMNNAMESVAENEIDTTQADFDLEPTVLPTNTSLMENTSGNGPKLSDKDNDAELIVRSIPKFPNKVVEDANYYFNSRSSNVAVGICESDAIVVCKTYEVRAREFRTLQGRLWINGLIIDAFVAAHIDMWDDVTYIPTDSTSIILGEFSQLRTCRNRRLCKIDIDFCNRLLMPYLQGDHWYLLAAQIKEQEICIMDPYSIGGDQDRAMKAFEYFVNN